MNLRLLVILLGCVFAIGCDDRPSAETGGTAATASAAPALPADLFATEPLASAEPVADVRDAQEGEEVVVRGRIAGRANPFTEDRAQFQLVDVSVPSCADNPDENCPTPWDMCCTDRKEVVANSITVQVLGPDGTPVRTTLNGIAGLQPMSEVAVKGTVKKSPDGKVVSVNATQIHVKQG